MNIETVLYLIDISTKIHIFILLSFLIYFALLWIILFFVCMGCTSSYEDDRKLREKTITILKSNYKKMFFLPVLILFISFFIPCERTMYLMLGANYLKNSSLPSKVESAIEKRIDKYLNEDNQEKKDHE